MMNSLSNSILTWMLVVRYHRSLLLFQTFRSSHHSLLYSYSPWTRSWKRKQCVQYTPSTYQPSHEGRRVTRSSLSGIYWFRSNLNQDRRTILINYHANENEWKCKRNKLGASINYVTALGGGGSVFVIFCHVYLGVGGPQT